MLPTSQIEAMKSLVKLEGNMVKVIETFYNGYHFRSRLEARWAVFFDTLSIKYEYEREGYDLGIAGWYLPDFWLPHYPNPDIDDGKTGIFAEIKPVKASEQEFRRALALAEQGGLNVFIMQGEPYRDRYVVTQIQTWDLGRLETPIILQNLQFKPKTETDEYPGFAPAYTYSIQLGNDSNWAGGFVCPPLYGKGETELNAAYLAARRARF